MIAVAIFVICSSMLGKNQMQKDTFDYEGHRGCRGLMPENTIPAFINAVRLGVTTLEMDAVISKDKQVVISHEPFFNHEITTKPDGSFITEAEEKQYNIYQMNYDEVVKYDVGMKPHTRFPQQRKMQAIKPLLSKVIDSVEAFCKEQHIPPPQYNIETKSEVRTDNVYHPEPKEFVDLIMQIVKEKKIEQRVIIQSFDIRTLQYVNKKYSKVKTSYLYEPTGYKSLLDRLRDLGFIPTIYSPVYTQVTPELVEECKQYKMKLIPWTVNDIETMQSLKKMGVDGLISDYPNMFQLIR